MPRLKVVSPTPYSTNGLALWSTLARFCPAGVWPRLGTDDPINQRDGATSDLGPGGDLVAHSPIDGPCATRFVTPVAIDLGFIIGLLAISAAPLVLLRGSDVLHHSGVLAAIFIAWFGGVALWTIVVGRMGAGCAGPTDITAVGNDPRESRSRLLLAAALLFAFAVTAFFLPLRLHFWGGFDEFISLIDKGAVIWSDAVDTKMGRPLIGMQSFIASLLAPDRIEGVLYVAVGLCFLNALLLMGIIRRLLPGGVLIGMAAAVFFVVNRSEPLIFFVAWATNVYWMALFWFLLALYLLLVSHVRKSRWLLAVSCVSLGAALLTSEGLFPLALVGPLLLYFQRDSSHPAVGVDLRLVRHRGAVRDPVCNIFSWGRLLSGKISRHGEPARYSCACRPPSIGCR